MKIYTMCSKFFLTLLLVSVTSAIALDSYVGKVKRVAYVPISTTEAKVSIWVSPSNDINAGKWCYYQGIIDHVKSFMAIALSAENNKSLLIVYTPTDLTNNDLYISELYVDDQ